jgi:hypothetical protein
MKTKIKLGESVNNELYSSIYELVASPTYFSVSDSVKTSLRNSVWYSGYDRKFTATWGIRI